MAIFFHNQEYAPGEERRHRKPTRKDRPRHDGKVVCGRGRLLAAEYLEDSLKDGRLLTTLADLILPVPLAGSDTATWPGATPTCNSPARHPKSDARNPTAAPERAAVPIDSWIVP